MTTVKELIAFLENIDGDKPIIILNEQDEKYYSSLHPRVDTDGDVVFDISY